MTIALISVSTGARSSVKMRSPRTVGATFAAAVSSAPVKAAAFSVHDEDDADNESGLGLIAGVVTGLAAIFLLITGPAVGDERVRWRALGTYMTVTSPYFDSEIVAAWNYDPANPATVREPLLARFADRQLIEMIAQGNEAYFVEPALAD